MKPKLIYLSISFLFTIQINLYSQSITASHNKSKVDSLIFTINPDASLLLIKSDSVLIDGTSLSWHYRYHNINEGEITHYYFHTCYDSVSYDSLNHSPIFGPTTILKPWVDSDSILFLAENLGGKEFRNSYPNYKISVQISGCGVGSISTCSGIYYISLDDPKDKIYINIDATDYSVTKVDANNISHNFVLCQNYPNPFNPSTTIEFMLPENDYIKLSVYNILGQKITTLVNENLEAGLHKVNFNSNDLSSGIYYYQLNFKSNTQIRKMNLIK